MKKYIILTLILVTVMGVNAQEKNIKYMFQCESGFAFSPLMQGFHQTFINGVTIDGQHSVGFGLGIGEIIANERTGTLLSMPVFLNYRCNFLTPRRSPFINVSMGISLRKSAVQLYSGITAGMQIYKFSISSGILFQTVDVRPSRLLPAAVVQIGIRL